MKSALRLSAALLLTALVLLVPTSSAGAAPTATTGCSATTCITLSGQPSEGFPDRIYELDYIFSFTTDAPLTSAVFTTTYDRRLRSDNMVIVDGAAAVAATPTADGHGFTINLAADAPLPAGTHHLTYRTSATNLVATEQEPNWVTSGSLDFAVAGGTNATSTSADVLVPANGERWTIQNLPDTTAHAVIPGAPVTFDFRLTRYDTSVSQPAMLSLHSYGGIDPDSVRVYRAVDSLPGAVGDAIDCQPRDADDEIKCLTPALPIGVATADFQVLVVGDHLTGPGQATGVGIWVQATVGTPLSRNEFENYLSQDIDVVDHYNLAGSVVPSGNVALVVGKPTQFKVTVTNRSDDVVQPLLQIAAPILEQDPDAPQVSADTWANIAVIEAKDDLGDASSDGVLWLPSLRPHASESVTLTIAAKAPGVVSILGLLDLSRSDDNGCTDETCSLLASTYLVTKGSSTPHVTGVTDARGNVLGGTPSVSRGGVLKVTLGGFTPHAKVHVALHSTTRDLGTVQADASGAVTYTLTVPQDLEYGAHSLTFTSGSASASVNFTVAETLASTGVMPREALWIGLGSLALGVGLVLASRRRRRVLRDETLS